MSWQPIETAPKDKRLLLWTGQERHLRLLAGAVLKYSCGYENAELEEACQVAREYLTD